MPDTPLADLAPLLRTMREARPLVLLLDYDGTLVPHADTPELAQPDVPLIELLERVCRRPDTHVHVVSGRDSVVLEDWFGRLPIGLHAEHGATSRRGGAWTYHVAAGGEWRPDALAILHEFTAATPGSLIEHKPLGLAWHYRLAEAGHGAAQADELRHRLTSALALAPVEITCGQMLVELRPRGANKGLVVAPLLTDLPPTAVVAAFGDDRTDEDMFAALPPDGLSFKVGPAPTCARARLRSVTDVRAVLAALLD